MHLFLHVHVTCSTIKLQLCIHTCTAVHAYEVYAHTLYMCTCTCIDIEHIIQGFPELKNLVATF